MKKQLLILLAFLVAYNITQAQSFITTWDTSNPGTSNNTSITIPTFPGETYNYDVDWDNDGDFDEFGITGDITHDFGVAGVYTIRIEGDFPQIYFNNEGDKDKILSVEQWGTQQWLSMESAFFGCTNLEVNATDAPDLSNATNMSRMFSGAMIFNNDINLWDTSTITNMSALFQNAESFNKQLDDWNTSNVTSMENMFNNARSFNKRINNWDVSNVINFSGMFKRARVFNKLLNNWNTSSTTDMSEMFHSAQAFNQSIGNWDTTNVLDMSGMFKHAIKFNRDIGNWDTTNVEDLSNMFQHAINFNQDIGNWDTTNVSDMSNMFMEAYGFNQDVGSWNTESVTNMSWMFYRAKTFNQDISNWNTENVNNMAGMFHTAYLFNQDLNNWDTSNVTDMSGMFASGIVIGGVIGGISNFNGNISSWNTSNVTDMTGMFRGAYNFSQDISNWDTTNVVDMKNMFHNASSFDQSIGNWDISNVVDMTDMFLNVTLSTENYDDILIQWETQDVQSNVNFHGGNSRYCSAVKSRNGLIQSDNWSITDNGPSGLNCSSKTSNRSKDITNFTSITIYPNPVKDKLIIKELDKRSIIKVFDVNGKELIQRHNTFSTTQTINISSLDVGLYYITIDANGKTITRKIIKE